MDSKKEVLELFKLERKLDLKARECFEVDLEAHARFEGSGTPSADERSWEEPRPYDTDVQAGDVRLLSHGLTAGHRDIVFVAVLGLGAVDEDDDSTRYALTAPFSPYDHPGFPGEWATGLDSSSLRVLQLWNTQPFPVPELGKSWKVGTLPAAELEVARDLYTQQVSPNGFTSHPGQGSGEADEAYVDEEFKLLGPLHEAMDAMVSVL